MGKLISNFSTFLLVILVVVALLAFLAPNFGWRVDTVLSGSMEPGISTGDLVVTQPVSTNDIKVGDIITFISPLNERITTHRVMDIEKSTQLQFHTRGDANEDMDPYVVPGSNVIGRVIIQIPYFGYVSQFVKTPIGFVITFCVPGILIILLEIKKIWNSMASNKDSEPGVGDGV